MYFIIQEIIVLKRKIEEFEIEKDQLKSKVLEYQTKLASKISNKPISKTAQTKVIILCWLKFKLI